MAFYMNILEKIKCFRWENTTYLVKNSAFCGEGVYIRGGAFIDNMVSSL